MKKRGGAKLSARRVEVTRHEGQGFKSCRELAFEAFCQAKNSYCYLILLDYCLYPNSGCPNSSCPRTTFLLACLALAQPPSEVPSAMKIHP